MAKHRFTAKRVQKVLKGKKAPKKKAVKANKKATRNGPHSRALPGFEQVVNTRLNNFCESIGRSLKAINRHKTDVEGDRQGALTEMHNKNVNSYTFAGVQLTRDGGVEKIRVRLVDKDGATTASEPADEDLDGELGTDNLEAAEDGE